MHPRVFFIFCLVCTYIDAFLLSDLPLRVCLYFGVAYFSHVSSSSHPWSHVVIGMWHKYPNPKCTHVVSIDTLDRSVDPKTGIIRTERVLGCKQKAPLWIVKVCFPGKLSHPATYPGLLRSFLAVRKMLL